MQPGRTTNTGSGTMEVVAAAPRCQLLLIVLMAAMLLPGDERFTAACLEKNCHQDHRVTRKHRQRMTPSLIFHCGLHSRSLRSTDKGLPVCRNDVDAEDPKNTM
ncbi:hypothetical protein STEG23_027795 [Scotinomys teguina]